MNTRNHALGATLAAAALAVTLLTGCGDTPSDCDDFDAAGMSMTDGRGGTSGGSGGRGGSSGGGSRPKGPSMSKPKAPKAGTPKGSGSKGSAPKAKTDTDIDDCEDDD